MAYSIINHLSVVSKHTYTAAPRLTYDLYCMFRQTLSLFQDGENQDREKQVQILTGK